MLFSELEVENFKKGLEISKGPGLEKSLGIILEGEAAVYKDSTVLNKLGPGSCFGAAAVFLEDEDCLTSIIAERNCALVFISAKRLKEYFASYPDMALDYIRFLSGRISFLNKKIESFTSPSAEDALWGWIIRKGNGRDSVTVKDGYAFLARELNISRASLYRALSSLENSGKIVKKGSEIEICSP